VQIRLLGSLEVVDDEGGAVAHALRCGEIVVTDRLIEDRWGDDAPARSLDALHRHVSTLRRTLGTRACILLGPRIERKPHETTIRTVARER
jgi:DNA-binding SARP family transcriptional activator